MAKNRRRTLWWGLFGLLLLPIALYGCFPMIATALVKEGLTQQGFKNVTIRIGYPNTVVLPIHILDFEKNVSGELYHATFRNVDLEYHISRLLKGQLQRIVIGNGELVISSPASPSIPTTPVPKDVNSSSPPPTTSLTIEEIFAPLPMPPFEELIVGEVSIHRSQIDNPLQQILVKGSLNTRNGTLHSHIDIQGPDISDYEITLSGESLGDANIAVLSPRSTQPTLIRFTSQATRVNDNIQLQASLNIDIANVAKLVQLFYPVDHSLTQMTGTITADWNGTLPREVSADAIVEEKVGTIEGTIQIRADLPQLKPYVQNITVEANGKFAATHDRVSWTLSKDSQASGKIRADQLSLPESVHSIVPMNGHQLSLNVSKSITGQLILTNDTPSFTAKGVIQGDYSIEDFPSTLNFSVNHVTGLSFQELMVKGDFLFTGTLRKQLEPHVPVKQIMWNLSGKTFLRKETLTVSLEPQSSLKASMLPIDKLHIPQAGLTFQKTFTGTYDVKGQRWEADSLNLKIHTPQVTWEDKTLDIQNIKLNMNVLKGSPSTWETKGQIVVLGIETTINNITPPKTNWKFLFSAKPEILLVRLLGQTSDAQVSLYGSLRQHFITKEGKLNLKLPPITFSPTDFNLRDSIKPWSYPVDITAGQISSDAEAFWTLPTEINQQPFTITDAKVMLNINKLGGHYENIILEGLSSNMTFVSADTWSMPQPVSVTLAKLETGITISNMFMNFHLEPIPDFAIPRVKINKFLAQMFAGKVSSKDFVFDPSKSRHQLTLHAEGLDIGKILKLEQQEGLQGTGLLDGTIPVTFTENGVEVDDGNLAARPPGGIIRYQTAEGTAETLKKTNENMNLVLQALNNFHYDVLTMRANYDDTGKLLLATKLEGKNPDLQLGKRIHFNLNVEENIPALLKSLQVAKDIEGRIEKLIQRSEEKLIQGL